MIEWSPAVKLNLYPAFASSLGLGQRMETMQKRIPLSHSCSWNW